MVRSHKATKIHNKGAKAMKRADYELIAKILCQARTTNPGLSDSNYNNLCFMFSIRLEQASGNFDTDKFAKACGLGSD